MVLLPSSVFIKFIRADEFLASNTAIFLNPPTVSYKFKPTFMETNFWIEKAWGETIDNATFDDIEKAIKETLEMDSEHGAFWVGDLKTENVLEVNKGLEIFYVENAEQEKQIKVTLKNWEEVETFYKLFFESQFDKIILELKQKSESTFN